MLAACDGPQSWLEGAGREAETIERLFWVMLAGAAVIWTSVIGLAVYATRLRPGPHFTEGARAMVVWGGIVLPTVTVVALLTAGLFMLRSMTGEAAALTVRVDGEQWWWRVIYETAEGEAVVSANEIRLPAGRTVELMLTSDDVIHAVWIPALGGKMDMIPGRTNRLTLTPVRPGTWRGACAEYCGGAHAQMAFAVVVMEPDAFDAWLAAEAAPAAAGADPGLGAGGRELFLASGCGACHTIRGTDAAGAVGPDLTHVGGRQTIGAGILPMGADAMARWIAETERVKPGVHMPSFGMLPDDEIRAIADYLVSLE